MAWQIATALGVADALARAILSETKGGGGNVMRRKGKGAETGEGGRDGCREGR